MGRTQHSAGTAVRIAIGVAGGRLDTPYCKPTVWTRPACNVIAIAWSVITFRTESPRLRRSAVSPQPVCIITLHLEYTSTETLGKLSLTACSAANIQKLPVPPPVNKSSVRARHLSLSRIKSIQFTPSDPVTVLSISITPPHPTTTPPSSKRLLAFTFTPPQ